MRVTRSPVAVLVAVALVASLAGCGARVAPYLGATAVGPGSSPLGPATGTTLVGGPAVTTGRGASPLTTLAGRATGPAGGTATGSGAHSPAGGSGSSAAGGAQPAALTPATFNLNPSAEAGYCTGNAGNTGSATGVTPASITLGNVSGITGLVSNSFSQGAQAVVAAFRSVNRFGGICGRQLVLQQENDQQQASTNASDVQYLIPKVLAFVGSLSDADNGGVPAMVSAGVPDLGPAINTNRSNSPVYWSATGGSVTVRNGRALLYNTWTNGLKANGDLPSRMAVLSYSIPISAQAGQEYATMLKQAGVAICFQDTSIQAGASGVQMSSDVQSMHNNNCGGVFTTMDIVGNAQMLKDIQSQGYQSDFKLVSTTYEGYTPDQISVAGQSAAQGLQVGLSSVPLTDSNPAVQLYLSELATYEPGQAPSEFGLEAWSDAQLFIYALLTAGRNPTRASLVQALSQVRDWTSEGAFGAYTPSDRTGPRCIMTVEVRGNAFVRKWPASGLYCNGQMIDVGPAS